MQSQAVVACSFNPSTWKAEAGRSLRVQGQPGLQSEFQYSQRYTEKSYLKIKIEIKEIEFKL